MPPEIQLSLIGPRAEKIRPFLEQFERENYIRVNLKVLEWETAWSSLVRTALYNENQDVSEIGSSWVSGLIKMDALRPFDERDWSNLGGPSAFLPDAWANGGSMGPGLQGAIPWLTGARLLYYRQSLLEKAGIDPATAFLTMESFHETLSKLQQNGVSSPWLVTTEATHDILLNIGSWIWGKGGDFLTPDGKKTRFASPESLAGITSYFELGRFLSPEYKNLPPAGPDDRFIQDFNTATVVSGAWLYEAAERMLPPEQFQDIKVTLPPGTPYVGGSYLVVWKHSRNVGAAIKLINFLTRSPAASQYGHHLGLLPTRMSELSDPVFAEPFWQTSIAGIKAGRTFPALNLWGVVQDRLKQEFALIWKEVMDQPDADIGKIVAAHLIPLARRLNITLE